MTILFKEMVETLIQWWYAKNRLEVKNFGCPEVFFEKKLSEYELTYNHVFLNLLNICISQAIQAHNNSKYLQKKVK